MPDHGAAPPDSVFSWTQPNVVQLVAWLRALKDEGAIVYKKLVTDCGFVAPGGDPARAQERVSRWLGAIEQNPAKWRTLPQREFSGAAVSLRNDLQNNFPGEYTIYRPSLIRSCRHRPPHDNPCA